MTKCSDQSCPSRIFCERYTIQTGDTNVWYADFGSNRVGNKCSEFVYNEYRPCKTTYCPMYSNHTCSRALLHMSFPDSVFTMGYGFIVYDGRFYCNKYEHVEDSLIYQLLNTTSGEKEMWFE